MEINLPKNYTGIVEQLIRPTGIIDPIVDIRPAQAIKYKDLIKDIKRNKYKDMTPLKDNYEPVNQIDDLLEEIQQTIKKKERILVTTLTKRMAEELTAFMIELDIKVQYLHSDVETIERVEILRNLRLGKFDVIVGINLLREGLDLPEVSLVAILDADKEGFLRSSVSLIQTIGRATRHINGRVIMYADHITESMKFAIDETLRRRKIQLAYNQKYKITPQSIKKEVKDLVARLQKKEDKVQDKIITNLEKKFESYKLMKPNEKKQYKAELEFKMNIYADMLEFEKAAKIRDLIKDLEST